MASLSEISSINMGQSPESDSYNKNRIGLPFFQGNADFGEMFPQARIWCDTPIKIAKPNDILISVRAPIGALNIANQECCIGRGLAAITVNPNLCSRKYLWYALKSKVDELNLSGTGSTFKAIGKSTLLETDIPIPSLSMQNSISRKYDEISRQKKLLKIALYKLDLLVKSRFIEMFGEPSSLESKWPMTTIGNEFNISSGGTPSTQIREYWENGSIPWIGSNMCHDEILYKNDDKYITEAGLQNSSAKILQPGTVLIALVGATIGKTALLKFTTTTNQNIAALDVMNNNKYTSEYVFYSMQFSYERFKAIGGGKFKMANKSFIQNLPILCPPIELQKCFSTFTSKADKSKLVFQESLDKIEILEKSFMQEDFYKV